MEMVPSTHDNGMQKGAGSFWGASSGASACHPQGQAPSRPIQQLGSVNGFLFVSKTMDFLSMKKTHYRSPHSEQGKD